MCGIDLRRLNWTKIFNLLIFACVVRFNHASVMGDECDWTGSGLSTLSTTRGVTPVYLRCSAGRVTWLYPRGALRILLRLPGQDREFRACLKIHPDNGVGSPARLFLEGPRSLLPLYYHGDSGTKAMRCFNSKNGQAAIYVEANGDHEVAKRISEIEYDLQPLPKGFRIFDPTEECRPCTVDELAHAFCTSDLVTRGIIRTVENRDDLEISQMIVKVTKLIRHTIEDFSKEIETNSVYDQDEKLAELIINVGQHCKVSHGTGEFVFMARRKLGSLTLQCAPRLEDWAMLINKISKEGNAHCVLKS